MSRIGYARVSSTGQSLEIQLEKLNQAKCDRIYQEKRSGRTADRTEFQSCLNYLREGDALIITRLDRLARSVVHLAQLAKRFQSESIDLLVLDQNIDTCPSCKYNRAVFLVIHCYLHQAAILPYLWCKPPTWGNATIFPISDGSTGRVSGGSLFSDKCVLQVG